MFICFCSLSNDFPIFVMRIFDLLYIYKVEQIKQAGREIKKIFKFKLIINMRNRN